MSEHVERRFALFDAERSGRLPEPRPSSVTVAIRSARPRAASPVAPSLFLDLDEGLGALCALPPPHGLPLHLGDLLVPRVVSLRGRAALLWRARPLPAIPRRAPHRQVGGTQPLPAQQAPTAPGVLQPSAARTIFRLYATVNRRLLAFAVTSTSGAIRTISVPFIGLPSLLARDTKLPGGRCLTHIGREGRTEWLHGQPLIRAPARSPVFGNRQDSASEVPSRSGWPCRSTRAYSNRLRRLGHVQSADA